MLVGIHACAQNTALQHLGCSVCYSWINPAEQLLPERYASGAWQQHSRHGVTHLIVPVRLLDEEHQALKVAARNIAWPKACLSTARPAADELPTAAVPAGPPIDS